MSRPSSTLLITLLASLASAPALASSSEFPEEIRVTLDSAAAQGLPTAALEAKAREGMAKGVPAARIAGLLKVQTQRLEEAQKILAISADAPHRAEILSGAAFALDGGASSNAVRRLSKLPPQVVAPAMYSLGDLLRAGFSETAGLALVEAAATSTQPASAFSGLASTASELRGMGLSEPDVVASVYAQIVSGRSPVGAVEDAAHGEHSGRGPGNGNGNGNGNGSGNRNSNPNGN